MKIRLAIAMACAALALTCQASTIDPYSKNGPLHIRISNGPGMPPVLANQLKAEERTRAEQAARIRRQAWYGWVSCFALLVMLRMAGPALRCTLRKRLRELFARPGSRRWHELQTVDLCMKQLDAERRWVAVHAGARRQSPKQTARIAFERYLESGRFRFLDWKTAEKESKDMTPWLDRFLVTRSARFVDRISDTLCGFESPGN